VGVQLRTQELVDSHDSLTMLLFPVGQSLGAPHDQHCRNAAVSLARDTSLAALLAKGQYPHRPYVSGSGDSSPVLRSKLSRHYCARP
jgi:hypothetical protein